MRSTYILLFVALAIIACDNSTKSDTKATDKSDSSSVKSESNDKNIRNDISLRSSGITVKQAFLLFEDGKLVPEGNKVEVGQKVNMRLIIEGWKETDGKVFLGASEKIETDEGQTVLDEKDLFATYTEGIDAKDAAIITLTAVITRIDRLFKHFEVSFKVWDKKSDDNVSGSYRVYL